MVQKRPPGEVPAHYEPKAVTKRTHDTVIGGHAATPVSEGKRSPVREVVRSWGNGSYDPQTGRAVGVAGSGSSAKAQIPNAGRHTTAPARGRS